MLTFKKKRSFANGCVHLFETEDGYPIEVTDTFLPYYTKDAIGRKQNALTSSELGSRAERWMVGVSVSSGCPVRCKFCATGALKKFRNLTWREMVEQVKIIVENNEPLSPVNSREFKINWTRMGDAFLNVENVRKAIEHISSLFPNTHHYISTIGVKGSDFSWISGNITLQVSLHSLDEARRQNLIPFRNLMSISELGQIRTKSNLKTTLNLTLVDKADFDIEKLKLYFDPKYFFIKLSPINENKISISNNMGSGVVSAKNLT